MTVQASTQPHQARSAPILPGATVGVLGTGQLGRMFAIAARRMGYRVHAFSPDRDTPTGQVADREVTAAYEDLDALRAFARGVQVVTFEFENVPAASVEAVAEFVPVRPSGFVLHTAQHRAREKTFLAKAGTAGDAVRADRFGSGSRGGGRPPRMSRRVEDGELRLRRQGPGEGRVGIRCAGGVGQVESPAVRARSVHRIRA